MADYAGSPGASQLGRPQGAVTRQPEYCCDIRKEKGMSVVKVIEVIAESPKGWAEAAQQAVTDAAKTVKHIKHFYVENMTAVVEKDKIVNYRMNGKISFIVED